MQFTPQANVVAGYAAGLVVAAAQHGLSVSYGVQIPPDVAVSLTALITAAVPHVYDALTLPPKDCAAAPP